MEYEAYETDETYDDMNVVDCSKTEVRRSSAMQTFFSNVDLVVTE